MSNNNNDSNIREVGVAWNRESKAGNEYTSIKLGSSGFTTRNGEKVSGWDVYLVNQDNPSEQIKLSDLYLSMFTNKNKNDNEKAPDMKIYMFED